MGVSVYNICEVYIDDMLVFGNDDDTILTVFQRCLNKNVTNSKKLVIGLDTVRLWGMISTQRVSTCLENE